MVKPRPNDEWSASRVMIGAAVFALDLLAGGRVWYPANAGGRQAVMSKLNGFAPAVRRAGIEVRQARADAKAADLAPIVKELQAGFGVAQGWIVDVSGKCPRLRDLAELQ
jgi:hypothetical protein